MSSNQPQQATKTRNLKPFWILLALCGLPYLASWFYFANQDLLPEVKSANRGELIEPLRPVDGLALQTLSGEVLQTNDFKGNWILATVGSSACLDECQKNVYHITQIRRLMGKERDRIKRMFVLLDENDLQAFQQGIEPFGEIAIVKAGESDGRVLLDKMNINGISAENRVYIIDPLANLIMVYNSDADPIDISKDFKRLLKVVRIGEPKVAG